MDEPVFPLLGLARHRIGTDGAGVVTLVAGAGCPLRCRWCLNARLLREAPAVLVTASELIDRVSADDLYFRATGGGKGGVNKRTTSSLLLIYQFFISLRT